MSLRKTIMAVVLILSIPFIFMFLPKGPKDTSNLVFRDPVEYATWYREESSNNIAIGVYAGREWMDERYQFSFTIPNQYPAYSPYTEYSTTMTPAEHEVVLCVVRRAIDNQQVKSIEVRNKTGELK
jgi:hypothetical protein